METLIKQTREVGTSAGVLLPRSWLNKQVVVTLLQPSKEKIIQDVLSILFKRDLNEEIKGIYLFGSYAREDYEPNSDIDILVITKKANNIINYGNYEILLVSEENFLKKLPSELNYMSILREAKVILNRELIEKYKLKKYRFNFKKRILEIKAIFEINKDAVETCKENGMNMPDGIIYSIVLRLRELYLIKCILSKRDYLKRDFLKIVEERIYLAYIRIKRNEKELNNVSPNELKDLLGLTEKWLKELKD